MPDLGPQLPASVEVELKFIVPPEHLAAVSRAVRRGPLRSRRMQSTYYDTPDERLAAHGITIRLRKEGHQWVQTTKVQTADSLQRLEHNVDLPSPAADRCPALDLSRHDGTPAGRAIRVALAAPGQDAHAGLAARFRADVLRITRNVRVGGARVELALDTGLILAGTRSMPVCELEMELKQGPVAQLLRLASRWAARHGLWLCTASKAERGARLLRGESEGQAVGAVAPQVCSGEGRSRFLHATLQSCLAQILGNASEVGAGAKGEQLVHQLRVGLRRMRTALRELRRFAPGVDGAWERVLCHAFQDLGAHRDAVTVIPTVMREMRGAGIEDAGAAPRHAGTISPEAVVRDPAFQQVLLRVLAFCHTPQVAAGSEKSERSLLCKKLSHRLDRLHAQLAVDAQGFEGLSLAHQHRVRKRLKRLRYLAEFAAPLFDADRAARYLKSWDRAQDALGVLNDYRVARAAVHAEAVRVPRAKPALRWLGKRLRSCGRSCARLLGKAVGKTVFWRP
jgi:inorganic triphosphatase YgiF